VRVQVGEDEASSDVEPARGKLIVEARAGEAALAFAVELQPNRLRGTGWSPRGRFERELDAGSYRLGVTRLRLPPPNEKLGDLEGLYLGPVYEPSTRAVDLEADTVSRVEFEVELRSELIQGHVLDDAGRPWVHIDVATEIEPLGDFSVEQYPAEGFVALDRTDERGRFVLPVPADAGLVDVHLRVGVLTTSRHGIAAGTHDLEVEVPRMARLALSVRHAGASDLLTGTWLEWRGLGEPSWQPERVELLGQPLQLPPGDLELRIREQRDAQAAGVGRVTLAHGAPATLELELPLTRSLALEPGEGWPQGVGVRLSRREPLPPGTWQPADIDLELGGSGFEACSLLPGTYDLVAADEQYRLQPGSVVLGKEDQLVRLNAVR